MPFLLVELSPQAAQILRFLGGMVGFASCSFANTLFMVKPFSVLLLEALNVLVLRHGGSVGG